MGRLAVGSLPLEWHQEGHHHRQLVVVVLRVRGVVVVLQVRVVVVVLQVPKVVLELEGRHSHPLVGLEGLWVRGVRHHQVEVVGSEVPEDPGVEEHRIQQEKGGRVPEAACHNLHLQGLGDRWGEGGPCQGREVPGEGACQGRQGQRGMEAGRPGQEAGVVGSPDERWEGR